MFGLNGPSADELCTDFSNDEPSRDQADTPQGKVESGNPDGANRFDTAETVSDGLSLAIRNANEGGEIDIKGISGGSCQPGDERSRSSTSLICGTESIPGKSRTADSTARSKPAIRTISCGSETTVLMSMIGSDKEKEKQISSTLQFLIGDFMLIC